MKAKLEILLLFLGGIIRLCNLGSDIWYLITQPMKKSLFYKLSIASLAAPSVALMIIYVIILISDCCKGIKFSRLKLILFILFTFGDSIGLNYFVFTFVLMFSDTFVGDFYIIDLLFRSTALINGLFHSIPQICLQSYNNQILSNWNILTMLSVGISGLSLVYTLVKLVYAIDKVQQYENIYISTSSHQASSKVGVGDASANVKNLSNDVNGGNDDEIYEPST